MNCLLPWLPDRTAGWLMANSKNRRLIGRSWQLGFWATDKTFEVSANHLSNIQQNWCCTISMKSSSSPSSV